MLDDPILKTQRENLKIKTFSDCVSQIIIVRYNPELVLIPFIPILRTLIIISHPRAIYLLPVALVPKFIFTIISVDVAIMIITFLLSCTTF